LIGKAGNEVPQDKVTEKAGIEGRKSDIQQAPGVNPEANEPLSRRTDAAGVRTMTQKQREAIVDLLLLGMFADGSLKATQDQKLLSVIDEIGWQSYQTPDLYFQAAIAKARDASDTEEGIRFRLKKIRENLGSEDVRLKALDYLAQILAVNGRAGGGEAKFLEIAKASCLAKAN